MALALVWPVVAQAQRYGDERGERGERIDRVIRDCEGRTADFRRAVERLWGRERHEGDELDREAARLDRSLHRIRETWNRERDYRRTRSNVGAAIDSGREINRILRRHRFHERLQNEWEAIRHELNNLAEVFEQPRIRW
ncbi:MAG TPA: hypothetical protein VEZ11_19090 [Thermoanaerobaculia bacterium]|nr:hypothetical protein [Thermoanaerobaculia bacterium]